MTRRLVPPYVDSDVPEAPGDQLGLWAPTCLACRGRGWVETSVAETGEDAQRIACPQCQGSGIAAFTQDFGK